MKILTISPYISSTELPCFERNKTGFGYMVHDISKSLAETANMVDALTYNYRHKEKIIDSVRYLGYTLFDIMVSATDCLPITDFWKLIKTYPMSWSGKVRLFYCWLLTGYYSRIIKKNHYDIIHFHGISYTTDLWINLCKSMNQPFLITLHALTSFSDSVKLEPAGKLYERNFFRKVTEEGIPITVVGSGMKRIIEDTCNIEKCNNIKVVLNSFSFPNKSKGAEFDIRVKYNIPADCQIVLYVGNVCERKNQWQIIRAFDYLPTNIINNTYVLFLGGNKEPSYNINTFIEESNHANHFIYCGVVDKEDVRNYYNQANCVALISISEAFGLSLAEGMSFGLPCLAFSDMDSFTDLYSPDVMIGVDEHTDEGVALGLKNILSNKWNKEVIKEFSKRFESNSMTNNYMNVYKEITRADSL